MGGRAPGWRLRGGAGSRFGVGSRGYRAGDTAPVPCSPPSQLTTTTTTTVHRCPSLAHHKPAMHSTPTSHWTCNHTCGQHHHALPQRTGRQPLRIPGPCSPGGPGGAALAHGPWDGPRPALAQHPHDCAALTRKGRKGGWGMVRAEDCIKGLQGWSALFICGRPSSGYHDLIVQGARHIPLNAGHAP